MERYEQYKDSGVEWIGAVPYGWDVKRLKYLVSINDEALPETTNDNFEMEYVDISNVKSEIGILGTETYSFNKAPSRARRIVRDGDIIVSTVRTYLKSIAKIDNPPNNIIVSTGFAVVRPIQVQSSFVGFLFYSELLIGEIISRSTGVSYPAINASEIGDVFIPIPIAKEQTAIANYLDRKTAEIDQLIAQKERLLSLYEEEKTAIINQAVTRGINPDVKLKDSGIDWLGEIPEHWKIKRLRYIGSCQNGVSKGGDYFGSGFPFISYGDVYNDFILPQQVKGLAESTENDRVNYSVRKVDILFTRTSETADEIGLTSTCLKTVEDPIFSGFLIRFRPNENNLFEGFSKYYFSSTLHRLFFVKEMNIVTRASLSQDLLKKLPILLPSIQEQKQIALYLDEAMEHINAKIAKTKKIIALQKEYRTALISEVVTGKIRVTS